MTPAAAATPAPAATGLVSRGLTKSFGPLRANDRVDITLHRGEVHVVLGQNGAGKSTLVAMLSGNLEPDAGTMTLDGEELAHGRRRVGPGGIATVYQDLALVPSMTGLENIALALGLAGGRQTRAMVAGVMRQFGIEARLDAAVRDLELPERQRIAVLRALCQKPSVLLLDEPTTFLPPTGIQSFLRQVRGLAESGLAVMLITHRLEEARAMADRVTVLRQGRVVAAYEGAGLPPDRELALAVVGSLLAEPAQSSDRAEGALVLEAQDLTVETGRRDVLVNGVSLQVRRGEVLGVAGVDGNGQLELLEALAGLVPVHAGTVRFQGADVTRLAYAGRHRLGVHFVSGDRARYGIVPTFTVAQHFQYMLGAAVLPQVRRLLQVYDVRPPNPAARADRLSGGNQQKMVLACALERDAELLLLSYPTNGLDVQATLAVRRLLVEQSRRGSAIVVASSDLDELLEISHRVIVMNRGAVIGEQRRPDFDEHQLARWYTAVREG